MNIAESASIEQLLISRKWTSAKSAQVADMIIINTCAVRKSAEDRIEGRNKHIEIRRGEIIGRSS